MKTREFKDYYKILNIPETATDAEIKKAYRKLAMENHPDHNPDDPKSEDNFKEISEAYGVLMDPLKRREFDRFRSAFYSGADTGPSGFRYSQQDIFNGMFREDAVREIFEELNREFRRSGFRSGNTFFEAIFFGGAVGGLSRILGMIPGPLGRIGTGLRLAHMVGSSFLAYKRMKQAQDKAAGKPESEKGPDLMDSMKRVFASPSPTAVAGPSDLQYSITLLPEEAVRGTRKKISYKAGDVTEQLMVRIPENFPAGGKLRIKEKGLRKNDKRGDLILTVQIESPEKKIT